MRIFRKKRLESFLYRIRRFAGKLLVDDRDDERLKMIRALARIPRMNKMRRLFYYGSEDGVTFAKMRDLFFIH